MSVVCCGDNAALRVLRLLDGDGAIGADGRKVFVLCGMELRIIDDPRLVIPYLEEQRVYFSACPAPGAQAVIDIQGHDGSSISSMK